MAGSWRGHAFLFCSPVWTFAALADDAETCVKGSGDGKIAACTAVIESGKWKGRGLAWAYINRGWAYNVKEDYAHAIADETEAIRLNPDDANGYFFRGWAYDDTDQFDRAIADETKAIQLKPTAAAFNNRGSAHLDKLEFDQAIADFSHGYRSMPSMASPTAIGPALISTPVSSPNPWPTSTRRAQLIQSICTAPCGSTSSASATTWRAGCRKYRRSST